MSRLSRLAPPCAEPDGDSSQFRAEEHPSHQISTPLEMTNVPEGRFADGGDPITARLDQSGHRDFASDRLAVGGTDQGKPVDRFQDGSRCEQDDARKVCPNLTQGDSFFAQQLLIGVEGVDRLRVGPGGSPQVAIRRDANRRP